MYASPSLMWGAVLDIQGVKNCVPATTDFLSRKPTKRTIKTNKKQQQKNRPSYIIQTQSHGDITHLIADQAMFLQK